MKINILQISCLIRTINIQPLAFLINLTPYLSAMKNIVSMNNEWGFVLSFGLILLLLIGALYNTSIATTTTTTEEIPLYYVTTRDPQNPTYEIVTGPVGYRNIDIYRNLSELTEKPCQNETVVIFVHGWEETEDNVKERLNRVKLSLENNSFIRPLIGFSWPSDTTWYGAKFIAAENGPKLANLISYV